MKVKNKVKKDVKSKNSELTEVTAKLNPTKEAEYHQFHQVGGRMGGVRCVARCLTARCNSLDMRRLCTVASLGTPASSAEKAWCTSAK